MVQLVIVLRWGSACLCLVQLSKVRVNWLAGKTTLSSDLRKASCLSGQQTVRKAFGPQITAQGWPGLSEVEKKKSPSRSSLACWMSQGGSALPWGWHFPEVGWRHLSEMGTGARGDSALQRGAGGTAPLCRPKTALGAHWLCYSLGRRGSKSLYNTHESFSQTENFK